MLVSTIHRAISQIAEQIEDELDPKEFTFWDGGLTIRISANGLAQMNQVDSWQKLKQDFEQVGGCIL